MANSVKENYAKIAHRFYKLKAKWLGVDKIQYWDRNAPLPFSDDTQYSWEESVKIVLEAYSRFSPDLRKLANGFFANNWIDVPPRDGKRSGAFAMPLPNKYHPYLLLNFVGKQNDVLTLAHELGHGCHFLFLHLLIRSLSLLMMLRGDAETGNGTACPYGNGVHSFHNASYSRRRDYQPYLYRST